MCKWGTDVEVDNLLAFSGEWYRRTWKIDACIAPIVKALNDGGVATVGSCCGHGQGSGLIALADGRELAVVTPSTPPASHGSCVEDVCDVCGGSGWDAKPLPLTPNGRACGGCGQEQ